MLGGGLWQPIVVGLPAAAGSPTSSADAPELNLADVDLLALNVQISETSESRIAAMNTSEIQAELPQRRHCAFVNKHLGKAPAWAKLAHGFKNSPWSSIEWPRAQMSCVRPPADAWSRLQLGSTSSAPRRP